MRCKAWRFKTARHKLGKNINTFRFSGETQETDKQTDFVRHCANVRYISNNVSLKIRGLNGEKERVDVKFILF